MEVLSIIYALFTLSVGYLILDVIRKQRKLSIINKIPGPKTTFLFGNALELMGSPSENFKVVSREFCNNSCGLSRTWIGLKPHLLIYKSSVAETVLNSQKFIEKSTDYFALHSWLGTGLLTSTGAKWHKRRKMLTPAFHFKILEDFVDIFNRQSQKLVKNLEAKCGGEPFNIFSYLTLCTLDIILESAMGRSINAQDNSNSDYVRAIYDMCTHVVEKQTRPWLQIGLIYKLLGYEKKEKECLKILHGFSYETIKERRKELKLLKNTEQIDQVDEQWFDVFPISGKKKRLAFLDMLLEYADEHEALSDEDIREEVDTFMFEGHDTTAAALNWTLYLFGQYPEIQDKVYEEIESIFGKSDRDVTSSDIREMKYLECCIKEALRLFPSVPIFGREYREDSEIDGYVIPAGTSVWIFTYRLHRDPEVFPDPNAFIPERFFPENSMNRNPYAYVPFSAGPRNCIGQKFALMEEKVVLSTFLRKYKVKSLEKIKDLKLVGDVILRPEKDTILKIFPRNEEIV
ncbi:cytochrome P450 4c3 [Armadillidium vulgare]|nr:cytochrome P450 4c3 [Armadillidium vulgare]